MKYSSHLNGWLFSFLKNILDNDQIIIYFEDIMIKTLLIALNAKYIHSCLALYSLRAFCTEYQDSIEIREFTVNQDHGFILREIFKCRPDIIGFSCYIWNIEIITALVKDLKKVLPEAVITLGGPEISYGSVECPADIIVKGEGEQRFLDILTYYNEGLGSTELAAGPLDISKLPFPYADGFDNFANRIIYYESSRGCLFQCSYCLSGNESATLRVLPLERVYRELRIFLDAKVKQVKFVDRTFNSIKERAINLWHFLIENDNDVTNFHFEVAADLLDKEALELLSKVRKGMFQFEIGVQSTNKSVLKGIRRSTDFTKLSRNVLALRESDKIHLHLDLIAGLPGEGYLSFKQSFNDVYHLMPHALQLGFLKALKGTSIRENAKSYGMSFQEGPPYEVLKTNELSFDEICNLKYIAKMLDSFYNSGLTDLTLRYLSRSGAFEFYESLATFWLSKGYHLVNHGKIAMYAILYEYCQQSAKIDEDDLVLELIRFDLLVRENEKNPPEWLVSKPTEEKRKIYREIKKTMGSDAFAIQTFQFDIANWTSGDPKRRRNTILFRYKEGKGRGVYHEIVEGS